MVCGQAPSLRNEHIKTMPTTPQEALVLALQLAITAPTERQCEMATEAAERLIRDFQLTLQEIEAAKALAVATAF